MTPPAVTPETAAYLASELRKSRAALWAFESIARQATVLCDRVAREGMKAWTPTRRVTIRTAQELRALIERQRVRHDVSGSETKP